MLSYDIIVNTEDGSTTEQIYKGKKKQKVRGLTEFSLVHKNIILGTYIYVFNSFLKI